jgi:hypothetical protein
MLAAKRHMARCLKILTQARLQIEVETKLLIDAVCVIPAVNVLVENETEGFVTPPAVEKGTEGFVTPPDPVASPAEGSYYYHTLNFHCVRLLII